MYFDSVYYIFMIALVSCLEVALLAAIRRGKDVIIIRTICDGKLNPSILILGLYCPLPHTGCAVHVPASETRCSECGLHALGDCCCPHMSTGVSAWQNHKQCLQMRKKKPKVALVFSGLGEQWELSTSRINNQSNTLIVVSSFHRLFKSPSSGP